MINLQIIPTDTLEAVTNKIPSVKEELAMLKSMPFDDFINTLVSSLVKFAINLAVAILVFYAGRYIIRRIYKIVTELMIKRGIDRSLSTFVLSAIKMVLYFLLIVIVIGILGIETSSFIALFASAGIAVGMALSGTLQNFAGGVMILILKPYRIGDYIEAQGYLGTVKEIQIFHTIITTPDNKSIIIPNGGLSTGIINNWSKEDYRRVDWLISISYGDNIKNARDTILAIFNNDHRIIKSIEEERETIEEENRLDKSNEKTSDSESTKKRPRVWGFLWHKRAKTRSQELQETADRMLQETLNTIDPTPTVVVDELGDSAVILKARAWTRTSNYWPVYYDITEKIYNELPNSGVSFPFPQMDVHITK